MPMPYNRNIPNVFSCIDLHGISFRGSPKLYHSDMAGSTQEGPFASGFGISKPMWKDRLSRLSGGRGKPRHHLWRLRAIGSDGIDSGYARGHPEEDLCLAHRLLRREGLWLALRLNLPCHGHVPRDCHYRWRALRAAQINRQGTRPISHTVVRPPGTGTLLCTYQGDQKWDSPADLPELSTLNAEPVRQSGIPLDVRSGLLAPLRLNLDVDIDQRHGCGSHAGNA